MSGCRAIYRALRLVEQVGHLDSAHANFELCGAKKARVGYVGEEIGRLPHLATVLHHCSINH